MQAGSGKGGGLFARVSSNVVAALFVFALTLLTAMAALSTSMIQFADSGTEVEHTFFVVDNPLVNIVVAAVLFLLCHAVSASRFADGFRARLRDERFFKRCKAAILVVLLALSALWVFSVLAIPAADQSAVQGAVLMARKGDWSTFAPGEYMGRLPQQLGLFWASMLLSLVFGKFTAGAIQVANMFAALVICSSLGKIARHMGASRLQQLATMFLCIAFFPLVQYCTFVYGLMWGLALALLAVRLEMEFFSTGRVCHAVFSGICIGLGILLKNNCTVFFIGMVLYALVEAVDKRALKSLLVVAVMVPALVAVSVLPAAAAEKASGYELSGRTSWGWIAMGLQDGPQAPGWFNSYNGKSYKEAGFDSQAQAVVARENVRQSLEQFATGERDAVAFFSKKIASMWNNPTFQSFWITQNSRAALAVLPPVAALLSAPGVEAAVTWYLNPLQFIILLGALIWVATADWKSPLFYRQLVLPLVFLGGFICHLAWEAKCQYALPYFVLLFPYAVMGAHRVNEAIRSTLARRRSGASCGAGGASGAMWKRSVAPCAALVASCALTAALLVCGGYESITGDTAGYADWVSGDPQSAYVAGGSFLDEALSIIG